MAFASGNSLVSDSHAFALAVITRERGLPSIKDVSVVEDSFSLSLFIVVIGISSPGVDDPPGWKGLVAPLSSSSSSSSFSSCSTNGSVSSFSHFKIKNII